MTFSLLRDHLYLSTTFIMATVAVLIYQYSKRQRKQTPVNHIIRVISNFNEWNVVDKKFCTSVAKSKVIGLDCEWTSEDKIRHPVALLQMATEDICILFRLCVFKSVIPPTLAKLLADEKILKVGVDVWGDRTKLLHDHQIVVKGCLDLRYLVERTPKVGHIKKFGLSGMASSILKYELCKERNIRCSNWQQNSLSEKQIQYAAQDATIALKIFKTLVSLTLSYFSSLSLMLYSENDVLHKQAFHLCGEVVDKPYKCKDNNRKGDYSKGKDSITYRLLTRAKPLYENCKLEAPDGEPLCVCDMKKAQWYLDKELGVVVDSDPFTVRLNFEPSGRPELDNLYYIHEKKNCCVVCGRGETYLKKKIVPHEYRRYFPDLMKNHLSHDVVLLCLDCHRKSSEHDLVFRLSLAEECDAPLPSHENNKIHIDHEASRIRSAARALTHKETLPNGRIEELEKKLKDYFDVEEVTSNVLKEALNLDCRIVNENYASHGFKVVQYKSRTIGLPAFEAQWRQHFLDTMKPQYLPKMWSVNHNHERLLRQVKTRDVDFDVSILKGENNINQEAVS